VFELSVSLSDDLREFISERTATQKLGSADEYIELLLRGEMLRLNRDKVEVLIQEALDSGEPTPMTDEDWAELKRRVIECRGQRKAAV